MSARVKINRKMKIKIVSSRVKIQTANKVKANHKIKYKTHNLFKVKNKKQWTNKMINSNK